MRGTGSRRELPRCLGAALLAALQMLNEAEQQVPNGECCAVGFRFPRQRLQLEVLLSAPSQSCSAQLSDSQVVVTSRPRQMPAPDSPSHGLDTCSPINGHVQGYVEGRQTWAMSASGLRE